MDYSFVGPETAKMKAGGVPQQENEVLHNPHSCNRLLLLLCFACVTASPLLPALRVVVVVVDLTLAAQCPCVVANWVRAATYGPRP